MTMASAVDLQEGVSRSESESAAGEYIITHKMALGLGLWAASQLGLCIFSSTLHSTVEDT